MTASTSTALTLKDRLRKLSRTSQTSTKQHSVIPKEEIQSTSKSCPPTERPTSSTFELGESERRSGEGGEEVKDNNNVQLAHLVNIVKMSRLRAKKTCQFIIDASMAGRGTIELLIQPTDGSQPLSTSVTMLPVGSIDHETASITLGGHANHDNVSLSTTHSDKNNNCRQSDGSQVSASINNGERRQMDSNVYKATFVPLHRGSHLIYVKYNGINICGSPCKIRVEQSIISKKNCVLM